MTNPEELMTNREKLNRMNIYDLLLLMSGNCDMCIIRIISGVPVNREMVRCTRYIHCAECLADWLDELSWL